LIVTSLGESSRVKWDGHDPVDIGDREARQGRRQGARKVRSIFVLESVDRSRHRAAILERCAGL
jgi:hypothetical protein